MSMMRRNLSDYFDALADVLRVKTLFEPEEIASSIEREIELSGLAWEFGPQPGNDKMRFSLSLRNEANKLKQFESEYEFPFSGNSSEGKLGIPPREADPVFQIKYKGEVHSVDGTRFKHLFSKSRDGLRIALYIGDDYAEDEDRIADLYLCGELGEENVRDYVRQIDILRKDKHDLRQAIYLREDFSHFVPECHYNDFLDQERNWLA